MLLGLDCVGSSHDALGSSRLFFLSSVDIHMSLIYVTNHCQIHYKYIFIIIIITSSSSSSTTCLYGIFILLCSVYKKSQRQLIMLYDFH